MSLLTRCCGLLLLSTSALASGYPSQVKLFGGLNQADVTSVREVAFGADTRFAPGGGAGFEYRASRKVGLEADLGIWVQNPVNKYMTAEGLVKYWLGENLSVGLGVQNVFVTSGPDHFGVGGGVGLDFPIANRAGMILDARLFRGIGNTEETREPNHFRVFAGVRLLVKT